MQLVAAMDAVGGLRPVLGLHETVCSGAAGALGEGTSVAGDERLLQATRSLTLLAFLPCTHPTHTDGYARMAGKPALTVLHLGPGLANAAANLHNARRAGSPVVNLVGESRCCEDESWLLFG